MAEQTVDYEEFTEMVERGCLGWRHALGRNNRERLSQVNSVMFLRAKRASGIATKWEYSFAIRIGKGWVQVKHLIDPPKYDPLDPVDGEQNPSEVAMDVAMALMEKLGEAAMTDEPRFLQ